MKFESEYEVEIAGTLQTAISEFESMSEYAHNWPQTEMWFLVESFKSVDRPGEFILYWHPPA